MTTVSELIFRQITPADFFNINKQVDSGATGGGQSYIDVPVQNVDLPTWYAFFNGIKPENKTNGPRWTFEINSLGNLGSQKVSIGQRREATVSIRSQKLFSRSSNRIFAWHPDYSGFPRAPINISTAEDYRIKELTNGLRIFILKTEKDVYWAGWLETAEIQQISAIDQRFETMLFNPAGHIAFDPEIKLNLDSLRDPFDVQPLAGLPVQTAPPGSARSTYKKIPFNTKTGRSEEDIASDLFKDDTVSEEVKKTQKVIETFERNQKAVRDLKRLYKTCQITGEDFTFLKVNGQPYLEVHHVVPLGEGGADNPKNLVVISAHIHRMLHYANVEGIDLDNIIDNQLDFKINGEDFTITWLPQHATVIANAGDAIALYEKGIP